MKKKKQTKRKHGNGKQITLVVIVLFLIVAITAALLWLSDCGKNWDVRTWGDKFTKQEQVTKPGDSGNKKPVIPVIPEPVLYDAIEVGDSIKEIFFDTNYVISDEDIEAFKHDGKLIDNQYYLIYDGSQAGEALGVSFMEITGAELIELLGDSINSDEIGQDAVIYMLNLSYGAWGGCIWTDVKGTISDNVLQVIFDGDYQLGFVNQNEYICSPSSLHVQEVHCADILRKFIDIKSEAEYEQQN